jgi:hypothetical protein
MSSCYGLRYFAAGLVLLLLVFHLVLLRIYHGRFIEEIQGYIPSSLPVDSESFVEDQPLTWKTSESTPPYFPVSSAPDERFYNDDNTSILGFAIVGFPKCGTSTLHSLVDTHPLLATNPGETSANAVGRALDLEKTLRLLLKNNPNATKVGYKHSHDMYHSRITVTNFRTLYPATPLVVTVRHPILWFESYWNFRFNFVGAKRIRPIRLDYVLSRLGNLTHGVDTRRLNLGMAYFHHFLAQLGKTPQTIDPREQELLRFDMSPGEWEENFPTQYQVPNRILLTTTEQMRDQKNNTFLLDLQRFLGLSVPFPGKLPHVRPSSWLTEEQIATSAVYKEDICKPIYDDFRKILQQIGAIASEWIIEYFLKGPGVYTSGDIRPYLEDWKNDPCEQN